MPLTMIPSYRSWSTAIYLQVAMTLVMANKTQPNILFLLSDDVGMADTEAVDPAMSTPTLTRLAQLGVVMNQSYTLQTCTPTRSALLTGRLVF